MTYNLIFTRDEMRIINYMRFGFAQHKLWTIAHEMYLSGINTYKASCKLTLDDCNKEAETFEKILKKIDMASHKKSTARGKKI